MQLDKIILTQFRNYEKATLDFSAHINCFTGLNGMGKTNLLDAIYYLCMTKSNFNQSDKHVVQHNQAFFRLEGQFKRKTKKETIVVKAQMGKKKIVERNEVPYKKMAEHIGLFPIVIIKPEDTLMATGGSEERRKFLDNTLSQLDLDYLKHLIVYTKVLKQRNASLKDFAKRNLYDEALIASYNEQMIEPANYIFEARKTFVEHFHPVFLKYYKIISKDQEEVNCEYVSKLLENSLEDLLIQYKDKDKYSTRTNAGIHKDDIDFMIRDFELKKFASQGQLKSFILAMKLAQYDFLSEKGSTKPILLLDDIFDKLDANRVKQLIELVGHENFGQTFISDTGADRLTHILEELGLEFRHFRVDNGEVN